MLAAAALASGCGPSWDALDPSLGGARGSTGGASGAGGTGGCSGLDDGNECTLDTCVAGMAQHTPEPAGFSCTQGGHVCDGMGACVGCILDTDCGTSTACAQYTCNAGACPTNPNLAVGTSCGSSAFCDGAGTCVTCSPAASTMASSTNAPLAVPAGGSVTSDLLVTGAVGTINHVAVTLGVAGATVQSGSLSFDLTSPGNTTIPLSLGRGGASTGNFGGTTFDDAAPPPAVRILYASFTPGVAIPSAIPEHDLSGLMGEAANGTWHLQVADASLVGGATLSSWSLQVTAQQGNPPLSPATFASATAQPIPSGGAIAPTLAVSGLAPSLYHVAVTVMAPHPLSGRLSIALGSPGKKTIPLVSGIGGSVANVFSNTTFDDGATLLLGCTGAGCASANGPILSVVPQGSLSALVGDDPNGTWTLHVTDAGGNPPKKGSLEGWSLEVTPALCPMGP
jgi:subtilisin-like proprotein convertase family protein